MAILNGDFKSVLYGYVWGFCMGFLYVGING